ncbi:MAG: hypothetical protein ACRC5C_10495, partial [Bacilli bacterium]
MNNSKLEVFKGEDLLCILNTTDIKTLNLTDGTQCTVVCKLTPNAKSAVRALSSNKKVSVEDLKVQLTNENESLSFNVVNNYYADVVKNEQTE